MLRDDRNEPLQTTQDRTVDDHRARGRLARLGHCGLVRATVFEVEPLRELEVELDRGALERPAESVADGDVDLGAVECTVAWVDLPLAGVELLERLLELLFIEYISACKVMSRRDV